MSDVHANLEAAFELANKWREASGQDILAAWLPSHPVNAKTCLLASAFNLNCAVGYMRRDAKVNSDEVVGTAYNWANIDNTSDQDGLAQMDSGSGVIDFNTEEDAALFAKVSGFQQANAYVVELPDEIALVAWEFDNGQYQEYAVKANPDVG